MSKVYVGDTETDVILECGTDVSSASARSIEVRKPDGTTVTWSAVADGTTAIKYVSQAATFDQSGVWRLQAKVTIGTGTWLGETVQLVVYPAFA